MLDLSALLFQLITVGVSLRPIPIVIKYSTHVRRMRETRCVPDRPMYMYLDTYVRFAGDL